MVAVVVLVPTVGLCASKYLMWPADPARMVKPAGQSYLNVTVGKYYVPHFFRRNSTLGGTDIVRVQQMYDPATVVT